jgi:hypothetical protein
MALARSTRCSSVSPKRRGLSHTKLEDTKPEHLELSVQALDRLTTKTVARYA